MQNTINLGANLDTRKPEQKEKDFLFKEVVASASPVNWIEKPKNQWRRFPDRDQGPGNSCVGNTLAKIAGILLWQKEKTFVVFSASSIYQNRVNKPGAGMMGDDAFEIWRNKGIGLEQLMPSERLTDEQIDAMQTEEYKKSVAEVFKISNHLTVPNGEFETVASIIQQTGKGVMVWFYFNSQEWAREIPAVIDSSLQLAAPATLRHSVTAVDFFLFNGKKYLLIEDSAHFAGLTYHLISEELFKARNWTIKYPMNFKFDGAVEKPAYTFSGTLKFGDNSPAVAVLQDILKYEGFFPSNAQATGYFGAITAKALLAWQIKHEVAPLAELNQLQGKVAGPKTIKKLNELYGK